MKIKNIGLPLLICAAMILFSLFVPEKISGIYDEAMIGKPATSRVQEETGGALPVLGQVKLIEDYGKNANIICVMEDYSGTFWEGYENVNAYFEEEYKQPSKTVVTNIQEELDKLQQLSLLPKISLGDMGIGGIEVRRYMDISDDNRYLVLADLDFSSEEEDLFVRYDPENKKILACNYFSNTLIEGEEDGLQVWKGWSEYLGIGLEEAKRYYGCGWYKDVERGVYNVYMLLF